MGHNDAYSAIQGLLPGNAFDCGVNDLLLLWCFMVRTKAVLYTLLALGIKNAIQALQSRPSFFFSSTVLNVLVEILGLTPISTPKKILRKY